MLKSRKIIVISALAMMFLQGQLKAVDFSWSEGHYDLPLPGYPGINVLDINNYVTVTMYGGGVNQFYMYDNSELTKYDGSIAHLYLYDNTSASFHGGSAPMTIYVDPANTGWVKFYADNVDYGQSGIVGNWLSNGQYFQIQFTGDTYSHVQIVPEPTTLALLALGSLAVLRRRGRICRM